MTNSIVTIHPNGKRYSQEDREHWYAFWYACCSFTKTGERFGVSDSTIRACAKDEGWHARAAGDREEVQRSSRAALAGMLPDEMTKSLATVIELRDDKTQAGKTRLDAATFIMAIGGVAPVKQSISTVFDGEPPARSGSLSTEDLRNLSPDQLMEREQQARARSRRMPDLRSA